MKMKNKRSAAFIKMGRGWRGVLLSALLMFWLGAFWCSARGQVRPQFGLEGYGGSNKLFILSPWVGLRIGLGNQASLIFRYHYHNFQYDYYGSDGGGGGGLVLKTMKADLSRLAGTAYFVGGKLSGYVNLSYLTGSDGYRGILADSGLEYKLSDQITGLWSVYSVREKSVLWHPEEAVRWINTYSLRFGMKFWLVPNLAFNPNLYLMKNSEEVEGVSYSFGLIYSPKWWLAFHAYYFRYGEAAFYVFRGNYFSCGLNFYF